MRRSFATIAGLGLVACVVLAIMSVFYLQRIPKKGDIPTLQDDLRRQHGLCLSAIAPLEITEAPPRGEGRPSGLKVSCTMRPDIRDHEVLVDRYLGRIADSVLQHPAWRGRIEYVTVTHVAEGRAPRTAERTAERSAAR
ncbi:MAG: hypothetical protein ACREID_10010 [Planctomycetota bacterium]